MEQQITLRDFFAGCALAGEGLVGRRLADIDTRLYWVVADLMLEGRGAEAVEELKASDKLADCRICEGFGFYQTDDGIWHPCPKCNGHLEDQH